MANVSPACSRVPQSLFAIRDAAPLHGHTRHRNEPASAAAAGAIGSGAFARRRATPRLGVRGQATASCPERSEGRFGGEEGRRRRGAGQAGPSQRGLAHRLARPSQSGVALSLATALQGAALRALARTAPDFITPLPAGTAALTRCVVALRRLPRFASALPA